MGEGQQKVIRLIQHKRTGLYLTDAGQWTAELDKAHNLPSVVTAVRLARSLGLKDVELVLKFNGGGYDLRLEL